jgi:hypothetical protein
MSRKTLFTITTTAFLLVLICLLLALLANQRHSNVWARPAEMMAEELGKPATDGHQRIELAESSRSTENEQNELTYGMANSNERTKNKEKDERAKLLRDTFFDLVPNQRNNDNNIHGERQRMTTITDAERRQIWRSRHREHRKRNRDQQQQQRHRSGAIITGNRGGEGNNGEGMERRKKDRAKKVIWRKCR